LVSRQFVLAAGAAVIVIFIVGLVLSLNRDEHSAETMIAAVSASPETETPSHQTEEPNEAVTAVTLDPTVDATEVPTETEIPPSSTDLPPTETATVEPTASDIATVEPSPTDTATSVPTETPDETVALPVYIDYSGQIGEIDESGQIELGEMTVVLSEEVLETVEISEFVVVSGLIDDGGLLKADVAEVTTADAIEGDIQACEFDDETQDRICHPILLILSDAFQVSYDELDALHEDGFGIGEISRLYLLAEEADMDVGEIIQLRLDGLTWAEIIEQFPALSPDDLALGVIIGNGRGQTIRPNLNGARVYTNTSDDGSQDSQGSQTVINTSIPTVNTLPPPRVDTPVPPPVATSPPDSVTICHNGNTIVVDWDAWVNAHSKHGDILGACQ